MIAATPSVLVVWREEPSSSHPSDFPVGPLENVGARPAPPPWSDFPFGRLWPDPS